MSTTIRGFRNGIAIISIGTAIAGAACAKSANPVAPTTSMTATTAASTTTTTAPPTVTAISPASGGDAGGTVVTITGTNFATGAGVLIGGVSATGVTVQSSTTIVATTGAGADGPADVVVVLGSQSGKLSGAFTYVPPQDTVMSFTVYNHTAGLLGRWTATLQSGTTVALSVGALGLVVDDAGNVVQPAIAVDSADATHIVVRGGAQGGRVGDFVASSTTGDVSFVVPYTARAAFDVFVMNAQHGADYALVDSGALAFGRDLTISRGADTGGATGPDQAITNLVRQQSLALTFPWMTYGSVTRTGADGQILVTYTQPNAGACVTYTRSRGMLYVNPGQCAAAGTDVSGAMLEGGFELETGVKAIFGANSDGIVDWGTAQLSPVGRDLLAYVFLKDSKGW